MKAKIGEMQPQAGKCPQPLEHGRIKEQNISQNLWKEPALLTP